ncbi:MAG: maleylpyruvate isomerase family mycothiol-dependent enzyme [Streptosporangiaceae bacterium]
MPASARTWIEALRGSQQRLASLVGTLSPEQLRGQSYDTDWNVAQVLSHIGSQAQIAQESLTAILAGDEPPGLDDFKKIWAVWDARTPDEQAAQCLIYDATHVAQLDGLTDEQLDGIHAQMFGQQFDAVGLVWLRLGEHALHSWDVAVTVDQSATVAPESVALLMDRVSFVAQWAGKASGEPFGARVHTTGPEREFQLDVTDSVSLAAAQPGQDGAGDGVARFQMPAEALLRLVYGRLDPAHTPPVTVPSGDLDLDRLRQIFPGF